MTVEAPSPAGAAAPTLSPRHREDLVRSGLSDDTIRRSGIRSASAEEVHAAVGLDAGSGMLIPYGGARLPAGTAFHRVKPDRPYPVGEGKTAKYLSPPKRLNPEGNRLYVPPTLDGAALADPSRWLIVTEGEKKILKAVQEGFEGVALAGIWSWRKRDEDHRSAPISDLFAVDWRDRGVFVVFDSDAATNADVQRAERALRDELERRGARVFVVRLPEPTYDEARTHGPKFGLDDFLVARGRDALTALLDRAHGALPLGAKTAAALLAEADSDEPWLIEGVWPEAGCGFFAGEPKSKKSFLALLLAYAVVTGRAFLGRGVRRGPVLIVDEENDRRELKKRMRRVARGLGVDPQQKDIVIAAPSVLRLDDDESVAELDRLMSQVRPALVVLDPFVRLHRGDENDASSVAALLGRLRTLSRAHRCAIVVVHHMRKKGEGRGGVAHGQRMRGSSDFHGWLDAAVYTEVERDAIKLTFESRYAVAPEPIHVNLADAADAVLITVVDAPQDAAPDDRSDSLRAVLARQSEPLTKEQLKGATGLGDKALRKALESLRTSGELDEGIRKSDGGRPAKVFRLRAFPSDGSLRGDAEKKKKSGDGEDLLLPPSTHREEAEGKELRCAGGRS